MEHYRKIKIVIFTQLLLLFVVTTSVLSQTKNIAYIHFDDTTSGISYKALLDSNGYSTDLIYMWDIDDTDFINYSLIIVGPDTTSYYGYAWSNDWMYNDIKNSELPVLALSYTGQRLYEKLGLSNNWAHGATGDGTAMVCVDTSFIIYNSPNNLSIPLNATIDLYTSPSSVGVEYGPSLSSSVSQIGQATSENYYVITADLEKYWLWGFQDSPVNMTQTGKDLFVNIVDYMLNTLVSVDEEGITKPESFKLNQNYPNPFNPTTKISYSIPSNENVTLKIYNLLGSEVATLVNEKQAQGSYEVSFNATDLTSGIYFYKITSDNFTQVNKMMLLK